jgi:predicted transposase YbfD/YdcC
LKDAVADTEWAPFLATTMRVTRRSWLRDSSSWRWTLRQETSFYVCSAAGLPASYFAAAIRNHWDIENRNHHVRDVSLFEDQSRIRTNPGVMARIRSFTLNILRFNKVTNIANALWENALCFDRLCSIKGI